MSAKSFRKMVVPMVALVCISAGFAQADKLQLQEKLSKDVKIQLRDVTIVEALEKIGQKAGVKFVLSDEAVWKLPYGEATRLSVALDGPLTDSMTEMLNAFFMRYTVGDEEITIYPRPELEHILGRPTAKQLELLKDIYTNQIRVYYLDEVQKTMNEALNQEVLISPIHIQGQLDGLLRQLVGKDPIIYETVGRQVRLTVVEEAHKSEQNEPEDTELLLPTPVTLVQLISQVQVERNEPRYTRWYISGMDFARQIPEIRVVSVGDFRKAKLGQVVDISFKDEKADAIIQRLAKWTGMRLLVFKNDPSWLSERISVDMQNVKLRQAILNIVSTVNGKIDIDVGDNEIRVYESSKRTKKPATSKASKGGGRAGSDGYVGKISIPMDGGKYYIEFMLRESDLTGELKKLREEKMKEILGEVTKPAKKPTKSE